MKNKVNSRRGAAFLAFMVCFGLLYLVLTPVQNSEAAPPSPPSLADLEQVDPDKEPLKDVDPDSLKALIQQDENALLGTYIVQLHGEPLATYRGGIPGIRATSPLPGQKLDARSPQSRIYMNYLDVQRERAITDINQELGRSVKVLYEYKATLHGFATKMTPEEAAKVAQLSRVKYVEREVIRQLQTDAGPAWLGAEGIWDGSDTGGLPGTKGEGIIVGVIDTGIDPWSPSFAATGGDGYTHTNPLGAGTYLGVCDPSNTDPAAGVVAYDPTFLCNDKLIGVWGYTSSDASPRDTDGHGSHTASTSAGNVVVDSVVDAPTDAYTATISGVAPHANIIMYDGCSDSGGCPGAALQAARDQALLDGVDVINYSIGGGVTADPWTETEAQSWLALRNAGVFVATSAGNSGPGDATLGSPADLPWMTSVGANSHNRAFLNSITISDGVTGSITLNGQSLTSGYGPAEIVFSSQFTASGAISAEDARLCADGVFSGTVNFNGAIVVCERGIYGRVAKGQTVFDGGAGGFILAQPDEFGGGPGAVAADTHVLPAVHIDYYEYQTLLNYVATASGPISGTISGASLDINDAHGDIMASFSSRGPNSSPPLGDIIVPKVTAPGRAIWAAYNQGPGGDGDYTYNVIQGTSMSSPHVAGAGALMKALHPSWTPAEIESALMTTARNSVLNDDGTNTATPFAQGSGHVDLSKAGKAGLVLDVTTAEFQAANPSTGGDPKALNLSSMGNDQCASSCSWTRTVKSTQSSAVTWSVTTSGGMTLTVQPNNFSLAAGATEELTITADVDGLSLDQWVFGEITLTPSDGSIPAAHMPLAVYVAAVRPEIEVDPSIFSSPQLPDVQVTDTLTINNPGTSDLNWTIEEAPGRAPNGVTSTITIWDQPINGGSGIVSDFYSENNGGSYSGDDFTLDFDTQVSEIFAPGFLNGSDLSYATKLSWYIYPDASGQPAGHPEDGGGSEVWSFSALPTAAGVDITDNNITLDLIAAGAPALNLTAGTYWLVVFPDIDVSTYGRWNWSQGTPRGAEAMLNDVGDNFGIASLGWVTLGTDLEISFDNLAFRLSGVVETNCDVPSDVPWLSVAPTSGTTPADSNTPVNVLFDSTGLATGTYSATLCINSNDATNPQVPVPVIMDVDPTLKAIIDVDPVWLPNAQETNNLLNRELTINNLGSLDLDWNIQETTARAPSVLTSTITFWDQPANGTGGIVSTFYTNTNVGSYSADDFVVSSNAEVDEIFADGFMATGTLSDAVKISWYIYPDASGQPAGQPEDGNNAQVWSFSALPTAAGVDITNNDITLDLVAAGAPALDLTPGTYWLVVYPDLDVPTYGRWSWNQGVQQGNEAMLYDAGNFGLPPFWLLFQSQLGLSFSDLAFRLSGTVESNCDAPSDLPWLTVGPTSGTTAANGNSSVNVLFDSTGLATGTYSGTLCVNSNDTTTPVVPVPVTLDVVPTVPALACNNGPVTFDFGTPGNWTVVDNEGNGVVWTTIVASGETGNYTGGSGNAATVSSDVAGALEFDTELRSPVFDLSGVSVITVDYLANYQNLFGFDFLDLDISTDGGSTWTTLLSWNEDHGSLRSTPGEAVSVDLSSYAGQTNAMLRWHYYDPNLGDWDWYAQIDDVSLTCSTAPLINVDPAGVSTSHSHFVSSSSETFAISNPGTEPLNWVIEEAVPLAVNRQPTQPTKVDPNAKQNAGRIQQEARALSVRTSNRAPSAVLYDQTDNDTLDGTNSQQYSAADAAFNNQAADDFVIPAADKGWRIEQLFVSGFYGNGSGPTPAVNVYFYQDNSGMPGTEVYSATVATADDASGDLTIDLPAPVVLEPGTYWVSVQADMDFGAGGQWYWLQRSVQSNSEFVWRNPADGFGSGCTDWSSPSACGYGNPDLLFSLSGSLAEACDFPSDIPWISSVSPLTGTTPITDTTAIEVTFNSSGLAAGTYRGSLCVRSDAAFTPLVSIPVTMNVARPSYGVNLSIALNKEGLPGSTQRYQINVRNTGNLPDTFTLSASGNWAATVSPSSVTLNSGEAQTVSVDVTIPNDATNGSQDTTTLTAVSTTNSSATDRTAFDTKVNISTGVQWSADMADSGQTGSTVAYTMTVENTGNFTDTFSLTVSGNSWTTNLSPSSVSLGAGASETINVEVSIPASAQEGDSDTATIQATSSNDSNVSDSANVTTSATAPPPAAYGVQLSEDDAQSAAIGGSIMYALTIINTSELSDTFTISATGNWTTTVSPSSIIMLPGESRQLQVQVDIPASAAANESQDSVVTVTSSGDGNVSDSANLTTTALPDDDADGIDNETEAGAPNNGDGNGDGIPDNEQENVASVPNQGSGDNQGYVTLAAPAGVEVVDVIAMPEPDEMPEGVDDMPQGMFEFDLNGLTSSTVVMTLTLHNTSTPLNTYYKHDENSDTWYEFLYDGTTGAVITDNGEGQTLVALHFVDGERGDADGIVNGVIDDPGAPGISMPPTNVELTSLDEQKATDWSFALLATLSLALGFGLWYRRRT